MRLFKTVGTTAVLVVVGLLVFVWFTTINEKDIYAFHEYPFDADREVTPGSVVALSKRGNLTRICDFQGAEVEVGPVQRAIYYNQLREDFPTYVKSIAVVKSLFGTDSETEAVLNQTELAQVDGRDFIMRNAVVTDLSATATQFAENDCERKMAWHLSKGYRACTVEKVLRRVVLQEDGSIEVQTVAVAFAEYSNFVTPTKFEEFNIAFTGAAAAANGKKCEGSSHPWTTTVKRGLNVIQRMPVSVVAQL
jgi:hypothetical protein